ncbi:LOW QUALITY PROTEIN: hypothetical protein OSB04_028453 [Centaurea solstitialis]|uniref:DUF4218 domain-containing protein n=1 Tax=Centaurea solstitialis TaxID=347529 RepID=A0AA38SZA5_9ASTR|nr:LOW QUALITY PROTEIN: hypothetical protein OSB04_028453 [Centaurea solstitialis]
MKLSRYYRQLCSKVLRPQDLVELENEIGKTLCDLERIFPPSFFDVMVHLSVHLALEAKIGGPVHYRWMYPIERYLSTLKSYVRNKRRPEGSIAEGYLNVFPFSLYLSDDIGSRHNRPSRNYDDGGCRGDQDQEMNDSILKSTDPDHQSEDLLQTLRSYSRTISELEELADDRNNVLVI